MSVSGFSDMIPATQTPVLCQQQRDFNAAGAIIADLLQQYSYSVKMANDDASDVSGNGRDSEWKWPMRARRDYAMHYANALTTHK